MKPEYFWVGFALGSIIGFALTIFGFVLAS